MAQTEIQHDMPLPRFDAPVRLLAVVASFYPHIAQDLLKGAQAVAAEAGVSLDMVQVPSVVEIPTAIALASGRTDYDGYVGLGCIVLGETTQYNTAYHDSSHGLMLLGLRGVCIGDAILTVENLAQAQVRAEPSGLNKGGVAVSAALHLIALSRRWTGAGHTETPHERDLIRLAGELDGESRA